MIKRAIGWIRVVLPTLAVYPFLVLLITVLTDALYLAQWLQLRALFRQIEVSPEILRPFVITRMSWLTVCAIAFGVFRAVGFHPLCHQDYRQWLSMTPWNIHKPLLGGPPWPLLQDVVIVLLLMLCGHEFSSLALIIPTGFLAGYLLAAAGLSLATGEWQLGYVISFWLATLPLLYGYWEWLPLAMLPCVGLAYWAMRRSLAKFPWELTEEFERKLRMRPDAVPYQGQLGWPFCLMAPKTPTEWIGRRDGLLLSLLLGWFEFTAFTALYNVSAQQLRPVDPAVMFFPFIPLAIGSGVTLLAIYGSHWPPISLWGRLLTGRWIISSYDKMAVLPALAVATSLVLHSTHQIELGAVGTTLGFLMLLVFQPRVEEWWLTGPHRINGILQVSDCVQLQ